MSCALAWWWCFGFRNRSIGYWSVDRTISYHNTETHTIGAYILLAMGCAFVGALLWPPWLPWQRLHIYIYMLTRDLLWCPKQCTHGTLLVWNLLVNLLHAMRSQSLFSYIRTNNRKKTIYRHLLSYSQSHINTKHTHTSSIYSLVWTRTRYTTNNYILNISRIYSISHPPIAL